MHRTTHPHNHHHLLREQPHRSTAAGRFRRIWQRRRRFVGHNGQRDRPRSWLSGLQTPWTVSIKPHIPITIFASLIANTWSNLNKSSNEYVSILTYIILSIDSTEYAYFRFFVCILPILIYYYLYRRYVFFGHEN